MGERQLLDRVRILRAMVLSRAFGRTVDQSGDATLPEERDARLGIGRHRLVVLAGVTAAMVLIFGWSGAFGVSSVPAQSTSLDSLAQANVPGAASRLDSAGITAPASPPLVALPALPDKPDTQTQAAAESQTTAQAEPQESAAAPTQDSQTRQSQQSSRGNRPPTPQEDFFVRYADSAQTSQRVTGVPASVTLAQAALESDWGKSQLARQGNNFFGIKAASRPGTSGVINLPTWEVLGGRSVMVQAAFRAYRDAAESFADHGHFFLDNSRYAAAVKNAADPNAFARLIHQAGYATDPSYATKLIALMQKYNLYQYNQLEP